MKIIYEDKYLIVVDKPVGASSQDSPDEMCVPKLLSKYRTEKGEDGYIGVVHRLDRVTGGVMVYGKTPKITSLLSGIEYKKKYFAVVGGCPDADEGTFVDYLYHDKQQNKSFVVKDDRRCAKRAELNYKILDSSDIHTLVEVLLVTGRTHQIRVQFSSRGMPIVFDGKYGSREKGEGIALHSHRLEFVHPITKKRTVCSSCPDTELSPWKDFSKQLQISNEEI